MTAPFLAGGKTGIMVCGHGSRNKNAAEEFAQLAQAMRMRHPGVPVEYGYLEFCNPVIHAGLDKLKAAGVKRILAVPGMLFAAGHAKNDIPSVLNSWGALNPDVSVKYGRELGIDLKMIRAAGERIGEALDAAGNGVPRHETLLMVVGRGSSDPDANSNVSKVARMLWEGMGFGWAETAYSGVTFPLVEPGLEHAARLGYKRIVVFPYFLFTGVLVKRIYSAADEVAAKHPDIEIIKAGYLNDHKLVLDTLDERVSEIVEGRALMNCQMCKYREQVLGFEAEVGLPQASHHHHVEGVGGAPENCPCKGDCDGSCRDEEFCRKHGLVFTPVHSHASPAALEPVADHSHDHHPHDHGYHHDHGHDHDHAHDHDHSHDHGHDHNHGHNHGHDQGHNHGHTHHPYPHADHPLGPKSLKKRV
jgi:sirohydrochlorin cobaltochelatase